MQNDLPPEMREQKIAPSGIQSDSALQLPLSRGQRVEMVQQLVGTADPAVRQLTVGLRAHTRRHYDRWVLPLIHAHWPAVLSEPFGFKLRFAVCNLYASAPYTVLLCAARRPPFFRAVSFLANGLPWPDALLALGGQGAMWFLSRLPWYESMHRRIVTVAAFIATIDHVFDHCLEQPPRERGRLIKALIAGHLEYDIPPMRLALDLRQAMAADLEPHERTPFVDAMHTLNAWVDAEVKGLLGLEDPEGLGHRRAGIEGTIDGLLVAIRRYLDDSARSWMVDVSLFVQMLDDWIDLEGDVEQGRQTLVATGQWTFDDIAAAWRKTVEGIESLVVAGGLHAPHYRRFIRDAYVLMLREVVDAMGDRSAA